jgi:hypothetical protein
MMPMPGHGDGKINKKNYVTGNATQHEEVKEYLQYSFATSVVEHLTSSSTPVPTRETHQRVGFY